MYSYVLYCLGLYIIIAYITMACIVMPYIVMVYIVMAWRRIIAVTERIESCDRFSMHLLCSYGLWSYGLYSYGLCSVGSQCTCPYSCTHVYAHDYSMPQAVGSTVRQCNAAVQCGSAVRQCSRPCRCWCSRQYSAAVQSAVQSTVQ